MPADRDQPIPDDGPAPKTDANQTLAFARQLLALNAGPSDRERLGDLLLDHMAVAVGGTGLPWVRDVLDWTSRYSRSGPAPVIGRGHLVAPEVAAFAHAVAAHGYELDDTHDASLSHPGAVVIPAAVAVAGETGATGAETLVAIAAGYEAMARLGESLGAADLIAAGFHPTALLGPFGAAAAAARLMRLGETGLLYAWGHALSLAGGSMQFSQEADGADVKRLHAGYAARAGVLAAEMTRAGIAAPSRSLDGRYGLLAMYGRRPDTTALTVAPEGTLAIHEISLKPYACNRLFHSAIDALREIRSPGLDVATIERIVVSGPRKLADQHVVRRPGTPMAAQYSLPFTIGAALVHDPAALGRRADLDLRDPRILAWADRVEVTVDPEFDHLFPTRFGAEIRIHTSDGGTRRARVLDSIGTPQRPMTTAAIAAKARSLMHDRDGAGLPTLLAAVQGLPDAPSISAITAAMSRPTD